MNILDTVKQIRKKAKDYGNYQFVADSSGVSFHWLQKFAIGSIQNPTVENVAKLESFFDSQKLIARTPYQETVFTGNDAQAGSSVSH